MRNLLKLLYTYHYFILFLILEGFSLFLVIEGSTFHHAKFVNSARSFTGSIYAKTSNIKAYVGLREENLRLAQENLKLKNQLENLRKAEKTIKDTVMDTTRNPLYTYTLAKVVNNSVNKQYNYITLDKGSKDGIKPDMGVITADGIVGIIEGVSENYSTVLSVLNMSFSVSAKIKKNGNFGLLHWNGYNDKICVLTDIPQHVKLAVGDTIVTTGYSGIFPENILIGKIAEFELKGGNFYTVNVSLFNEFRKLNYVSVIENLKIEEKKVLENKIKND
jgi:rod shape-determining protein MreC